MILKTTKNVFVMQETLMKKIEITFRTEKCLKEAIQSVASRHRFHFLPSFRILYRRCLYLSSGKTSEIDVNVMNYSMVSLYKRK